MKKLHLDMIIGETTNEEENDREHFSGKIFFLIHCYIVKFIYFSFFLELAQRVLDLNHRIADIRREQGYQRVSITILQ